MPEQLEDRVTQLEAEVRQLKRQLNADLSPVPWWEKIVGTFANSAAYDEAMQLGRDYRESLRDESSESSES
jgi:hypothetical protein